MPEPDPFDAPDRYFQYLDILQESVITLDVQSAAVLLANKFQLPIGRSGMVVAEWRRRAEWNNKRKEGIQ